MQSTKDKEFEVVLDGGSRLRNVASSRIGDAQTMVHRSATQARCGGGALLGAELRLKDGVCEAECDLKNKVESVRTSKCSNVARTGATTLAQDSVRGERVRGRALWCSHWEGDERSAR